MASYRLFFAAFFMFALVLITQAADSPSSIRQIIDAEIIKANKARATVAVPACTDLEFLRRTSLDLVGSIPTVAQIREFLASKSSNKREEWVDSLLKSPAHAWFFARVLDVQLMEGRPDKHVNSGEWRKYLRDSISSDKPYDQLVREILTADGVDEKNRPAAKFYLDREGEPHLLTRDISRLLLGANWQCAQCHDHPRIEDYKQDLYYGLYAFLNRSYVFTDPKTKKAVLAEKADGEASYQSVFDAAKTTKTSLPKVAFKPAIAEPKMEKGKEYEIAPAKDKRGVPKYSRRSQLAGELASDKFPPFARNIANRLWAHMMGRGLVHPLDLEHGDNPPSHPELLNALGSKMVANKFQYKPFLKEIALSKTYGLSSLVPEGMKDPKPEEYLVGPMKPLTNEQFAFAMLQASGFVEAEKQALGAKYNEDALQAKLDAKVGPVLSVLAGQPGQTAAYEARVEQALFLANNTYLQSLISVRPGSLPARLTALEDSSAFAEELYLGVLTRFPTPDEKKEVASALQKAGKDKSNLVRDLIWALITSAEFRFSI